MRPLPRAARSADSLIGWSQGANTQAFRRALFTAIGNRQRDKEASNRVNRGGNWNNNANNCRSANRNNNTPDNRNNNLGFRLSSSRPCLKDAIHGSHPGATALTIVPLPAPPDRVWADKDRQLYSDW